MSKDVDVEKYNENLKEELIDFIDNYYYDSIIYQGEKWNLSSMLKKTCPRYFGSSKEIDEHIQQCKENNIIFNCILEFLQHLDKTVTMEPDFFNMLGDILIENLYPLELEKYEMDDEFLKQYITHAGQLVYLTLCNNYRKKFEYNWYDKMKNKIKFDFE